MVLAAFVDAIAEWTRAQRRVIELVEGLTFEQGQVKVPACPDWTVRDLLSHVVGLGADVVAGDEPDDHNEQWTERQVAARSDRDIAALTAQLRAWIIRGDVEMYLSAFAMLGELPDRDLSE